MVLAAFTFNTSEFIPVGLLTDIAAGLGVTETDAGLLITVYAWVVALLSLPLMLLCARLPYRRLMLWVIGVFFVANAGSVLSWNYASLMASRIGVALSHCVFWSIAPAMAVAIAPAGKRATALAAVNAGGGIALIAGLPLGRIIGIAAGWRMAFAAIAALAALLWILMRTLYPVTANAQRTAPQSRRSMVTGLVHCRPLLMIYLIIIVIVTGHYTGYSYIEPFLAKVARLSAPDITMTLSLFGAAGLAGSFVAGKWFNTRSTTLILGACFAIPAALLLLLPFSTLGPGAIVALCIVWGTSLTVINICLQNDILRLFPSDSAVPMSLYSGLFNLGIGGGALVGGLAVAAGLLSRIGYLGGTIALAIALYTLLRYLPARSCRP